MSCSPTHTVPPGRFAFFGRIPGNKLPGYDHPVPPGQTSLKTVHKIEATPFSGAVPQMGPVSPHKSHESHKARRAGGLAEAGPIRA